MGDKTGDNVAKLPITPFSTNRCVAGINPRSIKRWMIFQSAASQPTSRTFCEPVIGIESTPRRGARRVMSGEIRL